MSSPYPQKKALPVFEYTKEGFTIIDAVPYQASYTKIFRAGMIVSWRPATVQKTSYHDKYGTGGQGVALVKEVDLHDPTYADAAALKLAGINTYDFPENRPNLGDQYGDLVVEDRDLGPLIDTIAGSMVRTAIAIGGSGSILCRMWDAVDSNNVAAQLAITDVGKTVYVSKTATGFIGKAGYGTVSDQSGTTGIVKIGTVLSIPIIGGEWAYIQLQMPGAV